MKRYLLFTFPTYDAGGGWKDFAGAFDTADEAKAAVPIDDPWVDTAQVVDVYGRMQVGDYQDRERRWKWRDVEECRPLVEVPR